MPLYYEVRGTIEGIVVRIILPGDTPPDEVEEVLTNVKKFADQFQSVEEFENALLLASLTTEGRNDN